MADQTKIKLFQSLRRYFQILGTFSPGSDKNRRFNPRNIFVLFCYTQLFLSVLAFTMFRAKKVVEFGLNYYGYMTEVLCVFVVSLQTYRMVDIIELIENCEKFMEMRKHATIRYAKVNEQIEQWSRIIYCLLPEMSFAGVVIPPLLITSVNSFVYNLKDESYVLPFPVILPFNWKTPLGYSIAILAQAVSGYFTLLSTASTLCLLVGSCLLFLAFVEDLTNDLRVLSITEIPNKSHDQLTKDFRNIMRLYSQVKQLVDEFNMLHRYVVFAFFLWTLSTIGSSLVVLQSESSSDLTSNPIEILNILTAITEMFWSFAICGFFCEFGERVTSQFNSFDAEIYRCGWWMLPIKMQKIYLIFKSNTQKPIIIRGYGNILCTREIFKETTNKGFSYFMMARQILFKSS